MLETRQAPTGADSSIDALSLAGVIRTPDTRARVFVSSTIDELAPERAAAREAITQLRLTPVLFESGARPYPPRELYRAYLAQSDIFVGLYWQRYGWVAPSMKVSGLEDEYGLANDKPRLIYIKTPAPDREPRLERLLDRIRDEAATSYQKFATLEELRERIANDLALLLTERFTNRSLPSRALPDSVPVPRSRLIGRDDELAQVRGLLQREDVGLITITGPGGVGKTRLALQAAAEAPSEFADGIAFVSLASIKDPTALLPKIAQTLHLPERGGSLEQALLDYLGPRDLLLVLDNLEQLISAAPPLASSVLERAPAVKLLVTSREPLRVRGEHVVTINPLPLPDRSHATDSAQLVQVPAVALFLERARETRPEFDITTENASTIVEICRRLDGLPLALELAAARLSLLSPAALLARLDRSLPVLTRGARDLPERQQTLRNTIAWSHDLLDPEEQQLFRRLAVFAGGFTLEAAQEVCSDNLDPAGASRRVDESAKLERLAQLIDKSLVQAQAWTGAEPRFAMLETIREYALEQQQTSGEQALFQEQHARYFLRLAEDAEPNIFLPQREMWLERLDADNANLRAALAWSTGVQERGEICLRLAAALSPYWFLRGTGREWRAWLDELLVQTGNAEPSAARGRALIGAGLLAWAHDDDETASRYVENGMTMVRDAGDKRWTALAAMAMGHVGLGHGNLVSANALFEDGYRLYQELGNVWGEALALYHLGTAARELGNAAAARAHYEESVQLFQKEGDVLFAAFVFSALQSTSSTSSEEQKAAQALPKRLQPLMRGTNNPGALGLLLLNLGDISFHHFGDKQQAKALYREVLGLSEELQRLEQGIGIAKALAGLAEVMAAQGSAEPAGRLLGAAARLLPRDSSYQAEVDRHISVARAQLDPVAFEAGWSVGQTMTEKEAISFAVQNAW